MTERPHGNARYSCNGCRCYVCCWSRSEYEMRRSRLIAQGDWQPFVPAGPARVHVEMLRAAGIGTRQVAALSGVSRPAILDLVRGVTTRVRVGTNAALLAVTADAPRAPRGVVSATGTARRTQALFAAGWTFERQASERGVDRASAARLASATHVTAALGEAVAQLFNELSVRPSPDTWQARRAQRVARRHGWFPPFAWDEDGIDNPAALPCILPPLEPVDRGLELDVQHVVAGHDLEVTQPVRWEIVRRLPDARSSEVAELARCDVKHVSHVRRKMAAAC